jgi:hypothetical protein
MSDPSDAGRSLARARWGEQSRALDRAVNTVVSRTADLSPPQLAALAEAIGNQEADNE